MRDYQSHEEQSQKIGDQLAAFVSPLLVELDRKLDKRLVRTFLGALQAIITFRHSTNGLLLSELGGYLLSPAQAPAGTKRLSNLLRSKKWTNQIIENYLWEQATEQIRELEAKEQDVFIGWDESVVEKPESIALEGLCAVRSSKAHRLKRIKPGYYNPPGGRPIFVPGMQWLALMVLGGALPPVVASMRWWTTRGSKPATAAVNKGKCCIAAHVTGDGGSSISGTGGLPAGSGWDGSSVTTCVSSSAAQALQAGQRPARCGQCLARYPWQTLPRPPRHLGQSPPLLAPDRHCLRSGPASSL